MPFRVSSIPYQDCRVFVFLLVYETVILCFHKCSYLLERLFDRPISICWTLFYFNFLSVFLFSFFFYYIFCPSSDTRRRPCVESARVYNFPHVSSCRWVRFSGAVLFSIFIYNQQLFQICLQWRKKQLDALHLITQLSEPVGVAVAVFNLLVCPSLAYMWYNPVFKSMIKAMVDRSHQERPSVVSNNFIQLCSNPSMLDLFSPQWRRAESDSASRIFSHS